MPKLGLGIGLKRGSTVPTPLQLLLKYTSAMWLPSKATGTSEGINSPFTSTVADIKGNAPLTLQGFAGTTSSGYVGVLCPNGKTVPFLKFDGTNDLGIANHLSLDITGTGDFAIECVFKTDATLTSRYLCFRGLDSAASTQYAILNQSDGSVALKINGVDIFIVQNGNVQPNSLYTLLVYRFSGVLKARLTKIETYNQINTTNILTKPHFRVGARTNSADGLTHAVLTDVFLGHLAITNGAITPFSEAELISKFDKFTMSQFGI